MNRSVTVVIPVFNSSSTLAPLVDRCCSVLANWTTDFEIILVNDCSLDDSWIVICQIVRSLSRTTAINLVGNYGQHNALLCGIRQARGDIIVTIDDDFQNPPEEILKLLDKLESGYDVVYGTPLDDQHPMFRKFASKSTKFVLQKAMGAQTASNISAFRAFRTNLRMAWATASEPSINLDVLLTWSSRSFVSVPVKHNTRMAGVSNYTTAKLLKHALNMITGFTVLPLRLAGFLGLFLSLLGFTTLFYILLSYLIHGPTVPGFAFLASIVSFFGGFHFLALGILGEYLARIHLRTAGQPQYVIKEIISNG